MQLLYNMFSYLLSNLQNTVADPVKLHFRLSNPHLTRTTIQIQYSYFLNDELFLIIGSLNPVLLESPPAKQTLAK